MDCRPSSVSYLSPSDQLDLHRYFQVASDKTQAELIEHRRTVQASDPSLPQRAGRAYARLMRSEQAPVEYSVMPDGRRISVRTLMRPEPDVNMLAKLFLQLAQRDIAERESRRRRMLSRQAIHASGLRPADAA